MPTGAHRQLCSQMHLFSLLLSSPYILLYPKAGSKMCHRYQSPGRLTSVTEHNAGLMNNLFCSSHIHYLTPRFHGTYVQYECYRNSYTVILFLKFILFLLLCCLYFFKVFSICSWLNPQIQNQRRCRADCLLFICSSFSRSFRDSDKILWTCSLDKT